MIRRHVTPALVLFSVLLASCFLRPVLSSRWEILLAACVAAGAAGTALTRTEVPAFRRAGIFAFFIAAGLLVGGVSLLRMSSMADSSFFPVPAGEVSDFSGYLSQDSSLSQKGETVLRVAVRHASSVRKGLRGAAIGNVLVFLAGDYAYSLGQELSFHARLSPFVGTGPEAFAAHVARIDLRESGFSSKIWEIRAHLRMELNRALERTGYPASALLQALLIGSREDVPQRLYEGFRRTGSLHILALSGLHVTVIYGIIAGVLGFIRRPGLKFLLATLVLLFYQFLAGFFPSLLRATVMILVGGVSLLLDRDAEPLNLLSISGIAIVCVDPFQAFSLSFQLSFLALAGILVLGPLVRRPLEGRIPRLILAPLAMSIGAQIATLPLVAAAFGSYYPSGLVASLILVPLTTAFLWAGLAWLPLYLVHWQMLHDMCAHLFSVLYNAIDWSAEALARLPGVTVTPALVPWVVGVSVAVMVVLGGFLPARRRSAPVLPA
jgi:competence protein ComEC